MTNNTRGSIKNGPSVSLSRRWTKAEMCDLQKNKEYGYMTAFIASEIPGLAGKVLNPGCNSVGFNTCLHLCTYQQSLIHMYIHIAIIIKYKV